MICVSYHKKPNRQASYLFIGITITLVSKEAHFHVQNCPSLYISWICAVADILWPLITMGIILVLRLSVSENCFGTYNPTDRVKTKKTQRETNYAWKGRFLPLGSQLHARTLARLCGTILCSMRLSSWLSCSLFPDQAQPKSTEGSNISKSGMITRAQRFWVFFNYYYFQLEGGGRRGKWQHFESMWQWYRTLETIHTQQLMLMRIRSFNSNIPKHHHVCMYVSNLMYGWDASNFLYVVGTRHHVHVSKQIMDVDNGGFRMPPSPTRQDKLKLYANSQNECSIHLANTEYRVLGHSYYYNTTT